MGYGPYNKQYDFGPSVRGEAKRLVEAHEKAVATLLMAQVPWLDVYTGDLQHSMAEDFITELQYSELSEQQVVDSYLDGSYDVDALLDCRLQEARQRRADTNSLLGEVALSPAKLTVGIREHQQTGYIETHITEQVPVKSFG
jgi:hypothetical protein